MNLVTDHTSHIGEQHRRTGKPNQDYVLSGNLGNNLAYAIVSDGCSSGGMTDVGSRLMVLATKRAIEKYALSESWLQQDNAVTEINLLRDIYLEVYRESLGLKYEDLLATCIWVVGNEDSALVNITGDGVIGVQYENSIGLYHFAWDQNIPYYPAYKLSGSDKAFKETYMGSPKPLTLTESNTNGKTEKSSYAHSVEEGMKGWSMFFTNTKENMERGKLISIALFSDGVEQVNGVSYSEVVAELMAFKSTNGQFAVRRMNRFLKDVSQTGKGPMDDISYTVINLSNTET